MFPYLFPFNIYKNLQPETALKLATPTLLELAGVGSSVQQGLDPRLSLSNPDHHST